MIDKLTHIENKICQLKKKKDRIQTQHAIFLMREAQKILKEEFSPEAALSILKDHWDAASPSQKEDWKSVMLPFLSLPQNFARKLKHATQLLNKAQRQRYHIMSTLEIHSRDLRRARTRFLIQLGGLIEKAELLKTFQIKVGTDLQKDIDMKEPVGALFKGLLVLNELANSSEVNLPLWARQGLEELRKMGKRK